MARELHIQIGGKLSTFGLASLNREKLYGKKSRAVVDETGNPCSARSLSIDGSTLLAPGGVAQMYVNEDGDTVAKGDRSKVDAEGKAVEATKSTLNVAQDAEEVPLDAILDYYAYGTYMLEGVEVDPTVEAGLTAGKVYKTGFAYRAGSPVRDAFLLKNGVGYFLLITEPHNFGFVSLEEQAPIEDDVEDDPFSNDFDFGMML